MSVVGYDVEVTDTIQEDSASLCPGTLELSLRRLSAILLAVLGFRLRRGLLILYFAHLGFQEYDGFVMVVELLLMGAVRQLQSLVVPSDYERIFDFSFHKLYLHTSRLHCKTCKLNRTFDWLCISGDPIGAILGVPLSIHFGGPAVRTTFFIYGEIYFFIEQAPVRVIQLDTSFLYRVCEVPPSGVIASFCYELLFHYYLTWHLILFLSIIS